MYSSSCLAHPSPPLSRPRHVTYFLATNRVHHTNDSRDEESQHNAGTNKQPEGCGDILLLARRTSPVGDPAGVALTNNGGRASTAIAVLLGLVPGLVQKLALAVAGAVERCLLARGEGVEEGWQDAANGAVALLVRSEDGEVLEVGVMGIGGSRRLGGEGKEGLGVLAVAARFDGRRHVVGAVGRDNTALRVARGRWHGDDGDVKTALSEAREGILEDIALEVVVLVGAEDGQVLVVERGLLEGRQGGVSINTCRVCLRLGVGVLWQGLGLDCEVLDEAVVVC